MKGKAPLYDAELIIDEKHHFSDDKENAITLLICFDVVKIMLLVTAIVLMAVCLFLSLIE